MPSYSLEVMTVETLLLEKHKHTIDETMERLLTGIAQGGDIKLDANINKVKDLSDSIVRNYEDSCQTLFTQLKMQHPAVLRQISVDQAKLDRTERSARAIKEREDKKAELSRKLKTLRKNTAESIRQQLNPC